MRNKPDQKKDKHYVTHFDEVPRAVSIAVALAVKKKQKKKPLDIAGDTRPGFKPGVGKILCRRARHPAPASLPGESHGQGAWWAAVYSITKSWTRLKRLTSSTEQSTSQQRK